MSGRVPGDFALDAATQDAVQWMVTLHSGAATAAQRRDFDAWLRSSADHGQAWQRLTGALDQALAPARMASGSAQRAPAPGALLGDVLARQESRSSQRRRLLRGALGLGGMTAGAALVAERHVPVAQLMADLRTGTGQRSRFTLPDGSQLTLDARSAVDLDFRAGHRSVRLRQGALIARVAGGQEAAFMVHTRHGTLRALGTGLVVRQDDDRSHVGMLEHSALIRTLHGASQVLAEGRSASFDAGAIALTDEVPGAIAAFQHGMLQAHDRPLGEVVQSLRAYRTGLVRITPDAAALRVSGSYSLDDTDRALTALAETLPLNVRVFQRGWLVVIERS